jgi:hypothetical protein
MRTFCRPFAPIARNGLCSEEGNADFIVTLNLKDFPQDRLKAKIISPAALR